MPYGDHFAIADAYIQHLDNAIGSIRDPLLQSRLVGFLAVSAVTVYELSIKTIFIDFAENIHPVLGQFARSYFDRINGRVSRRNIEENYLTKFGQYYLEKFRRLLEIREREILQSKSRSVKSSYNNIVTWRNAFVHEGRMPETATYQEAREAYEAGCELIHCLAETMSL